MNRIGRKAAVVAVTAIFGLGLLGTAALAAFAPAPVDTFSLVPSLPGTAVTETPKGGSLKTILDTLVTKGVITQAQEDAILAAVKDAHGDHDRDALLKRIFAGLFEQSATYLGMTPADLKAKLPGTTLAAVANATPGKSRDGLVAYLTNAANDAIAKALAESKITQEQADRAKAAVPQHVANFVDHTWPVRQPRPPKLPDVRAFIGGVMDTARDYLGLSQKDLMTQLRTKSLGEIANATPGKSRDGLVATLTTAANTKIDKAQADGKLTSDQATKLKAAVGNAVARVVDHKGPAVKSR